MRILLSAYPPSAWIYPAGKNAEYGKGQSSKEPGPFFIDVRGTPALRSSRPPGPGAMRHWRTEAASIARLSGLLRFVRDHLAGRVVRVRKELAKVLLNPLLGYPIALFRPVLILED